LSASLLSPWTRAGRHGFIKGALYDFGKAVQTPLDTLDKAMRRTMERYDITPEDWQTLKTFRGSDGALDLVNVPIEQEKLASRFLEMLHTESEFAVPSGNLRSRSWLIGESRAGTFFGELRRSGAMFMSFSVTLPYLHGLRLVNMLHRGERAAGAGYALAMLMTLTVGGAMAIQAKQLAGGRDPQNMENKEFWMAAALQGGGLGIYGDFLFADTNRFGGSMPITAGGPVVQTAEDLHRAIVGNVNKLLEGEQTTFGADLADLGAGLVPGSNTWYIKTAYDRWVEDALQRMLDPDAEAAFRRAEQRQQRDFGNGHWWRRGEALPERAPEYSDPPQ
jgi:hypothetical protein